MIWRFSSPEHFSGYVSFKSLIFRWYSGKNKCFIFSYVSLKDEFCSTLLKLGLDETGFIIRYKMLYRFCHCQLVILSKEYSDSSGVEGFIANLGPIWVSITLQNHFNILGRILGLCCVFSLVFYENRHLITPQLLQKQTSFVKK